MLCFFYRDIALAALSFGDSPVRGFSPVRIVTLKCIRNFFAFAQIICPVRIVTVVPAVIAKTLF